MIQKRMKVRNKLLLIGLGNPRKEYENTKHNMGFWIIDKCANTENISMDKVASNYIYGECDWSILIKPLTYMNDSGLAVREAIDSFKSDNFLIIYDDIDLPLGKIRYRSSGSDGGHRGIKSIIYNLNYNSFDRLRIGIATSDNMRPAENYVLSPFSRKYEDDLNQTVCYASDSISYYSKNGIKETMNNFNSN